MNVAVLGLWHLGSVTAACTAAAGHCVTAWDPDVAVVDAISTGSPPVKEPGLTEILGRQLSDNRLLVTSDLAAAVRPADLVWVTFDTPVDEEDRAHVEFVVAHVVEALVHVPAEAVVLVSSQLPVGTIKKLEAICESRRPASGISFACSPENLRLGKAIETFRTPDRVVVGARTDAGRERVRELFSPITDRLEWMSVESAEMTKHAVNAFLATSVAFINEIASVAERVGADAREVERGLKTERRIGPLAYLSPGGAFAGGTLARDVNFVRAIGDSVGTQTLLLDGVWESNLIHRGWARERLTRELGDVAGKRVVVWGLTYKPGTDTLRRSEAVALCDWLADSGATVVTHDPAASMLPEALASRCERRSDPIDAAREAEALVIATEWPIYREITADDLARAMRSRLVLDANGFLRMTIGGDRRFRLISVGTPQ